MIRATLRYTFSRYTLAGLLAIGAALSGCSDEPADEPPVEQTADASVAPDDMDVVPDTGVIDQGVSADQGPESPACDEGSMMCSGACVDVQSSGKHCGRCDNVCGGSLPCYEGACTCFVPSQTWCGPNTCVTLQDDARHCGFCDDACDAGQYCSQGMCATAYLDEVLRLTNEVRSTTQDCGGDIMPPVGPLSADLILAVAAQRHAEDMSDRQFFEHDNPDGVSPHQRMRAAGYNGSATGENIAKGQGSPAAVVEAWRKSPGHCRNMMSAGYTELGVGYHRAGKGGPYWVQNFGRP